MAPITRQKTNFMKKQAQLNTFENIDMVEYIVGYLSHDDLHKVRQVNIRFKQAVDNIIIKAVDAWKCGCTFCWSKLEKGQYNIDIDIHRQKIYEKSESTKKLSQKLSIMLINQHDYVCFYDKALAAYEIFCLLCANNWIFQNKKWLKFKNSVQMKLAEFDVNQELAIRIMAKKINKNIFSNITTHDCGK